MNVRDVRFQEAYRFAFEFVFQSFCIPLQSLIDLYAKCTDPQARCAYALSGIELVMAGVKTMTKFHRFGTDVRDDVDHFTRAYFPNSLRWEFKRLYRVYEDGLLFYQGFGNQYEESLRTRLEEMEQSALSPQKLHQYFFATVEGFRKELMKDGTVEYRLRFFHNYEKVRKCAIPA